MRAMPFALFVLAACNGETTPSTDDPTDPTSSGTPTGLDEDGDGYTVEAGDCNDADDTIHPGAAEIGCDNIDNDCNGAVDDGVGTWALSTREIDDDGDGTPETYTEYDYRPDGQISEERQDYDGLPGFDYVVTYTYDASGYLVEQVFDEDGTKRDARITLTNDSEGRLLRSEHDDLDDGSIDRVADYTYDGWDNTTRTRWDYDNDGAWDYVWIATYDEDRQLVYRVDRDGDGVWDEQYEHDYNPDGTVSESRTDFDDDPDWDSIRIFTYDADGYPVRTEEDFDNDGIIDSVTTYTTNDDGLILTGERDEDNDGTIDRRWEQVYDDEGGQLSYREDSDNDGTWDYVNENELDAEGRVVQTRTDNDGDGTWDTIGTFTWNGDQIASQTWDYDGDGKADARQEWTQDAFGNLLTFRNDYDADGVFDYVVVSTYECVGE